MSVSSHTEYWAGPSLSHSWNTGQNWPTQYIYMYLFIVYLIYTVLIYCNIHIIYNFSNMEKVEFIFFFFLILNISKNGVITFD